tara:strand:- start:167187 stop:167570 length:384 start_codon:yes stop_codon:yes gene_type:complete
MSLEIKHHGVPPKMVNFDFDSEMSPDTQDVLAAFPGISYESLEAAINEAIALEYLTRPYIGAERILRMTTKGFGAGHSRNISVQNDKHLTQLERASNWIEKHSALTNLIVGLASFSLGVISTLAAKP